MIRLTFLVLALGAASVTRADGVVIRVRESSTLRNRAAQLHTTEPNWVGVLGCVGIILVIKRRRGFLA